MQLDENWCLTLWLVFDSVNILDISTDWLPDVALSLNFTHNQFPIHDLIELRWWTNFASVNEHVIFKRIYIDGSKLPEYIGWTGKKVSIFDQIQNAFWIFQIGGA